MEKLKKLNPHLIVILLFVSISFAYFSPLLEGKMLETHDIRTHKGASKEISDFRLFAQFLLAPERVGANSSYWKSG